MSILELVIVYEEENMIFSSTKTMIISRKEIQHRTVISNTQDCIGWKVLSEDGTIELRIGHEDLSCKQGLRAKSTRSF